jgi:hypothetical protein
MSETDEQLFNKAVEMLRDKKYTSLEIIDAIEYAATGNVDARSIVNDAQKYVKETDEAAFECAVQAFKEGRSHFEVSKTLVKCGLHPFDSEMMASRAKVKADAELPLEAKPE